MAIFKTGGWREVMPKKILLAWSGGKDSAMALYEIQKRHEHAVASLLTTVTEGYERISMHGVRQGLLERQANALGLPLKKVYIPQNTTNAVYEARMRTVLEMFLQDGIDSVAFGDIFLEDLRQYREKNLAQINMKGLFPIWKRDSQELVQSFIDAGFKAIVVCVDSKVLDQSFAGKLIDQDFLRRLPPQVDPCGENGEFHSFVFDGPIFGEKVGYAVGETVLREAFWFCDLKPVANSQ
jgi:uncharacterized protein (TIGR00290 family)